MKRLLSILTVLSLFMITSLNAKTNVLQDETQEVTETTVDSTSMVEANEEAPALNVIEEAEALYKLHA